MNDTDPTTTSRRLKLADPADPFKNLPLDVVVVFEGGGAKCVSHIGAANEIFRSTNDTSRSDKPHSEWPKYQIRGTAGTSMGALIAALIAAGYRPEELIGEREMSVQSPLMVGDIKGQGGADTGLLCSMVRQHSGLNEFMDIFGFPFSCSYRVRPKYNRLGFHFTKLLVGHPKKLLAGASILWLSLIFCSFNYGISSWISSHVGLSWLAVFVYVLLTIGLTVFIGNKILKGRYSTAILANAIDKAMAKKIFPNKYDELSTPYVLTDFWNYLGRPAYAKQVRFSDLPMDLAVVASNITNRSVQLFSNLESPDVFVADAVAASMAVPILFKPVEMTLGLATPSNSCKLIDGGFVSNLPAWSFDAMRALHEDLHTLAIEISDDIGGNQNRSGLRHGPFQDFYKIVMTTVFGMRRVETRLTRNISVPMKPTVNLLDFEMTDKQIRDHISGGEGQFRLVINLRHIKRQLNDETCHGIGALVEQTLLVGDAEVVAGWRIRVSVLERAAGSNGLKTTWLYSSEGGFRKHPDDRLLYPIDSLPVQALVTGEPRLKRVQLVVPTGTSKVDPILLTPRKFGPNGTNPERYRDRLMADEQDWVLCVPLFEHNIGSRTCRLVVKIDSNVPMDKFAFDGGQGQKVLDKLIRDIRSLGTSLVNLEEEAKNRVKKVFADMARNAV
jgi:NTE family protein